MASERKATDIHHELLATLMTGHIGVNERANTYTNWKCHFGKICDEPVQATYTPFENISYLDQKGLIGVGKNEVLIKIFEKYDRSAVGKIEYATETIQSLRSDSMTDNPSSPTQITTEESSGGSSYDNISIHATSRLGHLAHVSDEDGEGDFHARIRCEIKNEAQHFKSVAIILKKLVRDLGSKDIIFCSYEIASDLMDRNAANLELQNCTTGADLELQNNPGHDYLSECFGQAQDSLLAFGYRCNMNNRKNLDEWSKEIVKQFWMLLEKMNKIINIRCWSIRWEGHMRLSAELNDRFSLRYFKNQSNELKEDMKQSFDAILKDENAMYTTSVELVQEL